MKETILFTIDVEDWFQVENFKHYIPYAAWPGCELRVERNVHRILDLLDSKSFPSEGDRGGEARKATFFVLGWIAERVPGLVREIEKRGHEVASHGYHHELCSRQAEKDLKADLDQSKQLLEDILGEPIIGYRAPNFSVDNRILEMIESCGYQYDASYNSFEMNSRYGKVDLKDRKKNGISYQLSGTFRELPLSNVKIKNRIFPFGGGGYLRLYPLPVLKAGIQHILETDHVYHFYIHPWEIDAEQPKVKEAAFFPTLRHYLNLHRNFTRLDHLMDAFCQCRFVTCRAYLGV